MEKYALLGYRLRHTMSPFIHRRLFDLSGKSPDYRVYDCPADGLSVVMPELMKTNGFNITIPHKEAVIPYLDGTDEHASRYRAVNTVDVKTRVGYNTDVTGFLKSLGQAGCPLRGKVLLAGLGGAGRMMACEAVKAGAELTVALRPESTEKGIDILASLGIKNAKVIALEKMRPEYDVLLNATPVGMYPKIFDCPFTDEVIAGSKHVFDAIYNPLRTVLSLKASEYGVNHISGMAMLVYQAAAAHEIWYGAKFRDADLSRIIDDCNAEISKDFPVKSNIVLTGFMGSGKSSLGKLIAVEYAFGLTDTDSLIESKYGKISDIFASLGEKAFREKESEIALAVSEYRNSVIAAGGGLPLSSLNVQALKRNGIIVYLDTPFELCYKRIRGDLARPLASDGDRDRLLALYSARKAVYENCADITLDGSLSLPEMLKSIKEKLKNYLS